MIIILVLSTFDYCLISSKDTQSIITMKKRIIKSVCFAIFLPVFLFSLPGCDNWERKPFYEADISDIQPEPVDIHRYDSLLFNANPFILDKELEPHTETYAFFLGEGLQDAEQQERLYNYVTDPFLIELYMDSEDMQEETDGLRASLTKTFRYYTYHFPEEPLPDIYTYISGIDHHVPVIFTDGHLIIGVDNYLGHDYEYYDKAGIPKYLSHWMRPESIVPDVARALADHHLTESSAAPETLLEHMIHEGKKQFFLDCMLPHTHDSLKINYTERQLAWMEQNLGRAWAYKLDNELLYRDDRDLVQRFIRKAPFTAPFSRSSAPQTGVYLGWQIVREYMERNPDTGLQDLLAEEDARKILTEARFRPR